MGSEDFCLHSNGFHLNGLLPDRLASVTRGLDLERWIIAEERTAELIGRVQPDKPSWEHRNAIASYVQRLIAQCISCVVFSYGSVPLRTYLPDGDIDLTLFSQDQNFSDIWATEVRDILEREQKNADAEYCVREVQLIHAEVKLVKCIVNNIVVDISFGQLSGLCTLCFLEEVDRHIGQNHLFKRSIILIKAWCYYESRLLGAYHGLISTYALETLILYIFRVFNNNFAGPLEVLYRFLEFFSKFDWDNLCISLLGPVPIGSLPDMTAYPPRQDDDTLLLNKRFLQACSLYYSVIPSTHVKEQFVSKHFNIIDFLRTSNNLGRSVSKGNFFRIRSAFAFGAQRLARLLDCPKECVLVELDQFFVNTWERHGKVHRPDSRILPEFDLAQEEHVVRKRTIKETNSAYGKADMTLNFNQMSLKGGEKCLKSEVLPNEVHFGHRFARTCSCPELMNARVNKERGRKHDKIIAESDHSRAAENCKIKYNPVDSSTREHSPSESYDADVDSASTSSRYAGDHVVGDGISSGVAPLLKYETEIHSPWIQTFGRQFVGFPLLEAGLNLNNFYYPYGLPSPSAPFIGRFSDDMHAESSNRHVDVDGLWESNVCSSVEDNSENGVLDNEYMERKQNPGTTNFLANIEPNTENGFPFSNPETKILYPGAVQYPIANMNYPTPNWVIHMPHQPSWPTSKNNYPPFPVTFFPGGLANPYASMLPHSTYTYQFNGKEGIGSAEKSEESTSDILSGDISSHVSNMIYGRSCQSLHFQGPLVYRSSIPPPQYLQGQFQIATNDAALPETPMPVSHPYSSQNLKNGYQYYPKTIPGHAMGTGTYLPNPKTNRDVQTPNSRYQRGNYRNQRKEQIREREVNSSFNSRPRFAGRSRKWEKPNPSYDRSSGRNEGTQSQWEGYGNYSTQHTFLDE